MRLFNLCLQQSIKSRGFWNKEENILRFIKEFGTKLNLTTLNDWNSITANQIRLHGGSRLLNKYSMFDIKCLGYPEGKKSFTEEQKSNGYWDKKENIINFLEKLKKKLNLNTKESWNSITQKQILIHGGGSLLNKYSLYEIKCFGCPEGKFIFEKPNIIKPNKFWDNQENIQEFLFDLKEKYNLNSPLDWNSLTTNQIRINGGNSLLIKYSLFEIKCMGCKEGKLLIYNKPIKFWENKENVIQYLLELKEKLNLNSIKDWNSLTSKEIRLYGGSSLLKKYSLFELKCLGFPDGKLLYDKPIGFWDNKDHVIQFIDKMKEKYNLKTKDDWNSLNYNQIISNGGSSLLHKYSIFELKSIGFSNDNFDFKSSFKSKGFWDDENNVLLFMKEIRDKYNLLTKEDWNLLTSNEIRLSGGGSLLNKYSMFELKCMGFPEGILFFKQNQTKPVGYWNDEQNVSQFVDQLKQKLNLQNPEDWNRLSKQQILFHGGSHQLSLDKIIQGKNTAPIKRSKNNGSKRSSQRWLFLQVQKLFPHEEIVEDYFHSEISRESGYSVQFDIFLINKNIAIEYHGEHHFEDIPSGFSPFELYQARDKEKIKLCEKYGVQLVIIPYWWDNQLDSLKATLDEKIIKSTAML